MEMPPLLIVRGEDLVVLGVQWEDLHLDQSAAAPRLIAAVTGGHIILTFPPQAIAEQKMVAGQFAVRGAQTCGPSRVRFFVPAGTTVPLTSEGILSAISVAGSALVTSTTDQSTIIEFPWGLITSVMDRRGTRVSAVAAGRPLMSAGVAGLWYLRFRGRDTTPADAALRLVPLGLDPNEPGQDIATLEATDRQRIVTETEQNGIFPTLRQFELSALGGSITARAEWPTFAWEHHTTVGRDQKVNTVSRGFLFPFGHRAEFQVQTERIIRPRLGDDLAMAGLHAQAILTVKEPVRGAVTGSARLARRFPFSQVEILTHTFSNISKIATKTHRRAPLRLDELRAELANTIAARDDAQAQVNDILSNTPAPGDIFAAADRDFPEAPQLVELEGEIASLVDEINTTQAAIAAADARISVLQHQIEPLQQSLILPDGTIDPGVQQQLDELNRQIAEINAEIRPLINGLAIMRRDLAAKQADEAPMRARVLAFLASLPRTEEALRDNREPSAVALFSLRDQVNELQAHVDHVLDVSSQELEVSFVVSFVPAPGEPPTPLRVPVRCRGRAGDVYFDIPMIFVHDMAFSEDDDFESFVSLTDAGTKAELDATFSEFSNVPLPGVRIDMLQAQQVSNGDIHEVSEISVQGASLNSEFWPTLSQFKIALPTLRALLPGHEESMAFQFSQDFIDQGEAADAVMALADGAEPIRVDFGDHPEQSGGLIAPIFGANVLSRSLGLVAKDALPGAGGDFASIFRETTMLGMSLGSLIETERLTPIPPKITPILDNGTPVGVLMEWSPPLKNHGPFVGNPNATLDLTVKKSPADTRNECTISNFSLVLPSEGTALVRLNFNSLKFTQKPGQSPDLQVARPDIQFLGGLKLLKELLDEFLQRLGGGPAIHPTSSGLTASYAVALPSVTAGTFLLRNIAIQASIDIPFSRDPVTLALSFASRDNPFNVSVLMFGGGGYITVKIGPTGLTGLEASLEFGAAVAVDFVVASGEVHALGGAHVVAAGGGVSLEAYIRIGGSVEVLGLVSVSVELRVELAYVDDNNQNRLVGRAKLVIEVDVLVFSDSVELDSGEWILAGHEGPRIAHAAPFLDTHDALDHGLDLWKDYRKAFAA
jgi:hypothetical protein